MPRNSVQDTTILYGLSRLRRAFQRVITWFSGGIATGEAGSVTEVNFSTGLTATQNGNRLTVTASGSGQANIQFEDEGTPLGTPGTVNEVDFVGSNVVASRVGDKITVTISGGGRTPVIVIPLQSDTQSTKFGSSTKLALGRKYFDPGDPQWGLSGTSVATFFALIEITNSANTANVELFQETGAGSPQIVSAPSSTNSTTAHLVSDDCTASFLDTSPAAIFAARIWTGTPNGNDETTCSAAWVEIIP